jgi:hypothetical protein
MKLAHYPSAATLHTMREPRISLIDILARRASLVPLGLRMLPYWS